MVFKLKRLSLLLGIQTPWGLFCQHCNSSLITLTSFCLEDFEHPSLIQYYLFAENSNQLEDATEERHIQLVNLFKLSDIEFAKQSNFVELFDIFRSLSHFRWRSQCRSDQ